MIITRTRTLKFNLGNYEMLEVGCSITLGHDDLGYTNNDARDLDTDVLAEELNAKCLELLNEGLASEIKDARKLTSAEKSVLIDTFAPESRTRTRKARRD
jgi:hypothetical protein